MSGEAQSEPILEPDLPIVDAHHHLWFRTREEISALGKATSITARVLYPVHVRHARYLFDEYMADIGTGHNVRASVFIDARLMYRADGPDAMKSVGEIEFVNGIAAMAASGHFGDARPCAGIVGGGVDLTLGDAVEGILQAHVNAGGGRYRGLRARVIYDDPDLFGATVGDPHLLSNEKFRSGFRCLSPLNLSCDVFILEPQLPELVQLARACPEPQIVLNHLGTPIGTGRHAGKREERFPIWRDNMRALADCDNVSVKLGGIGMHFAGFGYEDSAVPITSQRLADDWKPYIETCIELFGVNRCMFESNFPVDSATCSYPTLWNAFKRLTGGASAQEKTALYSGTATRVYRLELRLRHSAGAVATKIDNEEGNPPAALRMCLIAFLSYNVTMGCMFGSFGVLVQALEARLGITRELSSLGMPLVNLSIAITAPIAGVLVEKLSIRLLMLAGAIMNALAYLVLAISSSVILDLMAYGLLIGPGLALTATVLPSTLIARWFRVGRGRAFGLMSMPIVTAILPFLATGTLGGFGLPATYGMMAILTGLLAIPLLLVVDFPPARPDPVPAAGEALETDAAAKPELNIKGLIRSRPFWALSMGWATISMSGTVATAHLVPMTRDWGLDPMQGASVATAMFVGAMTGTIAVGWASERIGGVTTLALASFNSAILWAVLCLQPRYILLLSVAALLGFHGGAVVPAFSQAISQRFGQGTFGKALGLGHLVGLPLNFLAIPIFAHVYAQSHSYGAAIVGLCGFLVLAALFVASERPRRFRTASI